MKQIMSHNVNKLVKYKLNQEKNMISKEVKVNLDSGLHARPAAKFVQLSKGFKSKLSVSYNGKNIDPKSILGLLSLNINKGSVICISADGEDETQAAEALACFVQQTE